MRIPERFTVIVVFVATGAWLVPLACASTAPPTAVHPAAAPTPAAAVATPSGVVVRVEPGARRYEVRTSATVVLQSDTGVGASAPLRSVAVYSFVIDSTPDGLHVSGQLDSIAMSTGGRVRNTPSAPWSPVPFTARLLPRGTLTDLASSVHGDSLCAAALDPRIAQVASLFPMLPDTVRPGATWQDSVSVTTCRGSVPVQTSTVRRYEVDAPAGSPYGHAIPLHVTATSRMAGQAMSGGDTISVAGDGTSTTETLIDSATGALVRSVSQSSATVTVRSRHAQYPFRQEAADTIELLPIPR